MKFLIGAIALSLSASTFADDQLWQWEGSAQTSWDTIRTYATSEGGAYAVLNIPFHESVQERVVRFSPTGSMIYNTALIEDETVQGLDGQNDLYTYHTDGTIRKRQPNLSEVWSETIGSGQLRGMLVYESGETITANNTGFGMLSPSGNINWTNSYTFGRPTLYKSPYPNTFAVSYGDRSEVEIRDAANGGVIRTINSGCRTEIVEFSQDGYCAVRGSLDNQLNDEYIALFDPVGGLEWSKVFGTRVEGIAMVGNKVYATTFDKIHCFDRSGATIFVRSLPSNFLKGGYSLPPLVHDGLGGLFSKRDVGGTLLYKNYKFGIEQRSTLSELPYDLGTSIKDERLIVGAFSRDGALFQTRRLANHGFGIYKWRHGLEPTSATIIRGVQYENSWMALFTSSDGYWGMRPGITFTTSQAPISIELSHTAPEEDPVSMEFIVESRATSGSVAQSVYLYNHFTGLWDLLESNQVLPFGASTDRYATLQIVSPLEYIGPNREVLARFEYRLTGPTFAYPWAVRLDREMIRYMR